MLRSFIMSTIALTWPVCSAMLFVPVAVPLVVSVIASVAVPEVAGTTRSAQALNWRQAAMSKTFFASFFRTLLMISLTGSAERSSSFPVRHAVAVLGDRHGALRDGEVRLGHRRGFRQRGAAGRHVREDVPVERIALLLLLQGGVLDVRELAELDHGLHCHPEHLREVVRIHIPAQRVGYPNLTCCHDAFPKLQGWGPLAPRWAGGELGYPWPRAFFISAMTEDVVTGASCAVFAVLFKAGTSSIPALRSSFDGW